MHIEITKSGGLAGFDRTKVASIDTAGMTKAAAKSIEECIVALEREAPSVGTDMIRYDIHARDDRGKDHQLSVTDDSESDSTLRRLLDLLGVTP